MAGKPTNSMSGLHCSSGSESFPPPALASHPVGTPEMWESMLQDHEQKHGVLWKFGPVHLEDDEGLHGVFAKIASDRT